MIGLMKRIEKWFDMRIAYFLYNGNKQHRYQQYLNNKYLDAKTCDKHLKEEEKYSIPL